MGHDLDQGSCLLFCEFSFREQRVALGFGDACQLIAVSVLFGVGSRAEVERASLGAVLVETRPDTEHWSSASYVGLFFRPLILIMVGQIEGEVSLYAHVVGADRQVPADPGLGCCEVRPRITLFGPVICETERVCCAVYDSCQSVLDDPQTAQDLLDPRQSLTSWLHILQCLVHDVPFELICYMFSLICLDIDRPQRTFYSVISTRHI